MVRKRLRIAFTSIFYPVFLGRYLWEAMLQNPDIEVWSAGPYMGCAIPWSSPAFPNGMQLPENYVLKPNHPTALTQPPMVSYPMLEKEKPWEPDLWVEANAGLTAIGKPTSAPLAMVLTDPHVLGHHYAEQRGRADYVFGMQRPYLERDDIWLPYAYSPRWHTPTEETWETRGNDAALIGLQYANRNSLVNRLRSLGLSVHYELGPAYDDARAIYHNTRVGLNWSSLQDTTARCFELMAFGLPAVMNRVPDLLQLFEDGQDFIGFDNVDQAVDAVQALLADPGKAQEVGCNAREAVKPHTWDARVETILKKAGLLDE